MSLFDGGHNILYWRRFMCALVHVAGINHVLMDITMRDSWKRKRRMSVKYRTAEVCVPVIVKQMKYALRVAPCWPTISEMLYWPGTGCWSCWCCRWLCAKQRRHFADQRRRRGDQQSTPICWSSLTIQQMTSTSEQIGPELSPTVDMQHRRHSCCIFKRLTLR